MVMSMKKISIFVVGLIVFGTLFVSLSAQQRIAVLPFKNLDGKLEFNEWCFNLQDSLAKSLKNMDIQENQFRIVPIDSVEFALAELNLDPDNPQYFTDLWKAVKKMNVTKVVSGEFNVQGETIIINAKIYDVKLKLPLPNNQARDVFRKVNNVYDAIPEITQALFPGM